MSGGVDSSVVAAMLHEQKEDVIGITLKLNNFEEGSSTCCGGSDIEDAKSVASKIGIKHYVLNYQKEFTENVVDDFVNSYMRGQTPLPCVRCNQSVKFRDLLKVSQDLGATALATGHYVRRLQGKDGMIELHKAKDSLKDQSYFLFSTTQEQLNYLRFPLGEFSKSTTRTMAKRYNLHLAEKPDSQDICFIPKKNYRNFLSKNLFSKSIKALKGKVIHADGYVLGEHDGVHNYTIGQRKGIPSSLPYPLYVNKIDAKNNVIHVGPESTLFKNTFVIENINILDQSIINQKKYLSTVKIRSTSEELESYITVLDSKKILVELLKPVKAITPGQGCVIYKKSQILGGGWITSDIS